MTTSKRPPLSLIVAMARNHVIGIDNDLPWHIPADLQRFKSLTMGNPVIMGRKTFQSIEARLKRPLPGRPNIVVSAAGFSYPGVDVFPDLETAIEEAGYEHPDKEIMIIGGASIYEQAIHMVDRMHLTVIHQDVRGDAKFPEFDKTEWQETGREDRDGDPAYSFVTLERTSKSSALEGNHGCDGCGCGAGESRDNLLGNLIERLRLMARRAFKRDRAS